MGFDISIVICQRNKLNCFHTYDSLVQNIQTNLVIIVVIQRLNFTENDWNWLNDMNMNLSLFPVSFGNFFVKTMVYF